MIRVSAQTVKDIFHRGLQRLEAGDSTREAFREIMRSGLIGDSRDDAAVTGPILRARNPEEFSRAFFGLSSVKSILSVSSYEDFRRNVALFENKLSGALATSPPLRSPPSTEIFGSAMREGPALKELTLAWLSTGLGPDSPWVRTPQTLKPVPRGRQGEVFETRGAHEDARRHMLGQPPLERSRLARKEASIRTEDGREVETFSVSEPVDMHFIEHLFIVDGTDEYGLPHLEHVTSVKAFDHELYPYTIEVTGDPPRRTPTESTSSLRLTPGQQFIDKQLMIAVENKQIREAKALVGQLVADGLPRLERPEISVTKLDGKDDYFLVQQTYGCVIVESLFNLKSTTGGDQPEDMNERLVHVESIAFEPKPLSRT